MCLAIVDAGEVFAPRPVRPSEVADLARLHVIACTMAAPRPFPPVVDELAGATGDALAPRMRKLRALEAACGLVL